MSRRRPSRPVLPSQVPGCRWLVGVSVWPTERHRLSLILMGGDMLLAVVEPSVDVAGRWCAFVVGEAFVRLSTKREAVRWAERRVLDPALARSRERFASRLG